MAATEARAMPSAILDFVRNAKAKGVEDDAIVMVLRQRGWSDGKIYDALTAYYEESLGFGAPARGGRAESAREAFFYLLSFAMLGVWVVALVWLGDMLIDRAFPSSLDYGALYQRSSIAWQMASIIIAFPIYLWINYLLSREIAKRPETLDSGVRKWLTYIALVVTAGTLVGDGVWFLTTFLTGDITQRFLAKALMLFVIVGCVYWYYLATIRTDRPAGSYNRTFGSLAVAGVLLAVILGFAGIGSPAYGRLVNYDNQRTSDIFSLATNVSAVDESRKRMPVSLQDVDPARVHSTDPQTGKLYVYVPGKGTHYQLCATFSTDTRYDVHDAWRHPSGKWCYKLDASRLGEAPQNT
jgi:hypothetical protein